MKIHTSTKKQRKASSPIKSKILITLLSTSFLLGIPFLSSKAENTNNSSLTNETFLESQVNKQLTTSTKNTQKSVITQAANSTDSKPQQKLAASKKDKGFFKKKVNKKETISSKTPSKVTSDSTQQFAPISVEKTETSTQSSESTNTNESKELKQITKERKENTKKTIDAINFIQPSIEMSKDELDKVNQALTRAEQEQLTILWRATLERNKTIHFIVEKLGPDDKKKKKNQVLSQILNTAIFLPFYALQTVAPADTSSLASYIGAGLASDVINGRTTKNNDRMQLSQTEMVIMFMMIDQVAERLREQYHAYKQEKTDAVLAQNELDEAKEEALASLETQSAEARFLVQIRIRQIEREMRRINLRVRSNRIVLVDLSGSEAVDAVDKLIDKEIAAVIDLPLTTSTSAGTTN